jgi:hypothetical protein
MAELRSGDVEVRFVDEGGLSVTTSLGGVDGRVVVRGRPVRSFPTYPGQRNYPGWLWTSTTGGLVGYESLLERDRLWLADFDPSVRWIASQPFWMSGRDGACIRRHVPGFLLDTAKGLVVVDVKPAELLVEPVVADVLDWCGRLCAGKGWTYEVWSGDDPVRLRNVRFLAAGRRGWADDDPALGKVAEAAAPGMTLAQLEKLSGLPPSEARATVLALLWSGRCRVDLTKPLGAASVLEESV